MADFSPPTADWLVSAAAKPYLETAAAALGVGRSLLQVVQSLRKELSADQAHAILEQVELRPRAREKFSAAAELLLTRIGLQQATDEVIARYKAERFASQTLVADLCCGIGGDLMALAARGACLAVDRDPAVLRLAEHNVQVTGNTHECRFVAEDVTTEHVCDVAAWHLDPDRRPTGKRTVRLENFSPDIEVIQGLRRANPRGALKLAPASDIPAAWEAEVEREWISRDGECKQQVVWCDVLAKSPGLARATVFGKQPQPRTLVGKRGTPVPTAAQLGSYLWEPDAAVLAADLTGVLAADLQLQAVAAGVAYLTGNKLHHDPALATFAIRDLLPFDRKQLKSYFRERNVGRLEVKKRKCDVDPEAVRRSLDLQGEAAATLIICPYQDQTVAIIAERLVP
jgi:SAM-dependent methyltransferase